MFSDVRRKETVREQRIVYFLFGFETISYVFIIIIIIYEATGGTIKPNGVRGEG